MSPNLSDVAAMQNAAVSGMGAVKQQHVIEDLFDLEAMLSGPFQVAGIGVGTAGYPNVEDSMADFRRQMMDDTKDHVVKAPVSEDLQRRLYMVGFSCADYDRNTGMTRITRDPYGPKLTQWDAGDKAGFLYNMDQYALERSRAHNIDHMESFGFEEDMAKYRREFEDATSGNVSYDNAMQAAGNIMATVWRYKGVTDKTPHGRLNPYNAHIDMTKQEWGMLARMNQDMERAFNVPISFDNGFVQIAQDLNMRGIPMDERRPVLIAINQEMATQCKDYNLNCPGYLPSAVTIAKEAVRDNVQERKEPSHLVENVQHVVYDINHDDKRKALQDQQKLLNDLVMSRATFTTNGNHVQDFNLNLNLKREY